MVVSTGSFLNRAWSLSLFLACFPWMNVFTPESSCWTRVGLISICKEKVQVDGVLFGIQILSHGHIYLRKLTSQAANWVDDYQYLRICTRSPPSFAVTRFSPVFQERFRRRRWINSDRSAKVLRAGWEDWWPASREGWCFERFFTHI